MGWVCHLPGASCEGLKHELHSLGTHQQQCPTSMKLCAGFLWGHLHTSMCEDCAQQMNMFLLLEANSKLVASYMTGISDIFLLSRVKIKEVWRTCTMCLKFEIDPMLNPSRMPLAEVFDLSGDESAAAAPSKASGPKLKTRSSLLLPGRDRIKATVTRCGPTDNPKHLANLIRRNCGYKADCFSAFRWHQHRMEEWLKLRNLLSKMEKLEKDRYVRVLHVFWCPL